jgi:DNA repair protein RadA/Sms
VAEVQTLICGTGAELTRRVTSGLDSSRVGMMVAVLQRRAAVAIGRADVYASTVGGVRLTESAADLAVALALASAASNLSVPAGLVAVGEVGLAGEIRRVAGLPRRLAEAERMGFRRAIVPPGSLEPPRQAGSGASLAGLGSQMEVREAASVGQAIALALGG